MQIVCQKSFFCFFCFMPLTLLLLLLLLVAADLADHNSNIFDGDRDNKRTLPREKAMVEELSNFFFSLKVIVVCCEGCLPALRCCCLFCRRGGGGAQGEGILVKGNGPQEAGCDKCMSLSDHMEQRFEKEARI